MEKTNLSLFLIVIGFSIFLSLVFRKFRLNIFYKFHGKLDKMEEEINLLTGNIKEKKNILKTLPYRCEKISFLFKISQQLIEIFSPQEVYDFMIGVLRDLFPQADNILFFLLQKKEYSLMLTRSYKKNDSVIKEKEGDILDHWVLKHNHSLLVKEIKSDFRFDYSKVNSFTNRQMISFIASPLSIGDRIIGVVRAESNIAASFSLDDSRILRSICDLGAVVLERAYLFKKTEELAIKDSLTSLFLKNYFFDRLKEEITRGQKNKSNIGLIMIDIDDFKKINDDYGHVVGDLVLKKVAKVLLEAAGGAGNIISRFGGEEFIAFFVGCGKENLIVIAERIRKLVEESVINFRRKRVSFTVSLGIAFYPEDGQDSMELVGKVDRRLYKAKKEGKNRVCF